MPDDSHHPDAFPEPEDGQVQVLLLGTIHMETNRVDDVLDPRRQSEFRDLVETLADWNPDGVAVERTFSHQEFVDGLYDSYRSGERDYGEETHIEPRRGGQDDPTATCRNETVQVGFRLADHLDHDRVHAVDDLVYMDAHLDDELDQASFDDLLEAARESVDESLLPDDSDWLDQWEDSTVTEFLRWYNRPENLLANDENHYAAAFAGVEERYVGARLLTGWYERNLRIAENIWRAAADHGLERVLLVVGQGHVHLLRHVLATMPMTCPASPVPVLAD